MEIFGLVFPIFLDDLESMLMIFCQWSPHDRATCTDGWPLETLAPSPRCPEGLMPLEDLEVEAPWSVHQQTCCWYQEEKGWFVDIVCGKLPNTSKYTFNFLWQNSTDLKTQSHLLFLYRWVHVLKKHAWFLVFHWKAGLTSDHWLWQTSLLDS